ncbi:DMT family transporter [Nesterenkonia sp. NBAIMH1]|uniref:DMT family transporter n=1 Tax=Nesterenkonia sp. NBAIMH1 TaxID=2600320 RepID=UPI0011B7B202|nr:DMT family transporter [Nesterenkonia sp. NBAIMH1]
MTQASTTATAPAAPRVILPLLAILAPVLMWASTFVVTRWAAPSIDPGPFALIRLIAASLTLTVLALIVHRGRPPRPTRAALGFAAAFGALWFGLYTLLFNWAGHYLDAGTVALVVNFAPLIVGIGAVVFFKEAFSRPLFAGMIISLSGIALIGVAGGVGQLAVTGLVLAFGAAILYAAGMLLQKMVLRDLDPLTTTWLGALAGTVALLPFAPAAAAGIGEISAATVWAAVYMGIGPSALGFWFWGYAMTRFPTGRVASASLAVPAVVILMSLVTLGEVPPPLAMIGGAICLTGVGLAQLRHRRRAV